MKKFYFSLAVIAGCLGFLNSANAATPLEISQSLKSSIVQELIEKKDDRTSWRDFRLADPYGFYIRFTDLIDWGQ